MAPRVSPYKASFPVLPSYDMNYGYNPAPLGTYSGGTPFPPTAASAVASPMMDAAMPTTGGSWLDTLKGIGKGAQQWGQEAGLLDTIDPTTKMQTQGIASPLLALGQAGLGAYMGSKQLGLSQDILDNNRNQFAMNYGAQRQTTNTRMEDKYAARKSGDPGANQLSIADYMAKNRVV